MTSPERRDQLEVLLSEANEWLAEQKEREQTLPEDFVGEIENWVMVLRTLEAVRSNNPGMGINIDEIEGAVAKKVDDRVAFASQRGEVTLLPFRYKEILSLSAEGIERKKEFGRVTGDFQGFRKGIASYSGESDDRWQAVLTDSDRRTRFIPLDSLLGIR